MLSFDLKYYSVALDSISNNITCCIFCSHTKISNAPRWNWYCAHMYMIAPDSCSFFESDENELVILGCWHVRLSQGKSFVPKINLPF